jgi:putative ABC transport system permease protein
MLWTTLLMALSEIRRNAMRSFLTMLGIVIGVGAVIALVTVGDGTTASVTASISAMGENLLTLSPGADRRRGPGAPGASSATPFEEADVEAIRREISGLAAIAPSAGKSLLVVYGNTNWRTTVTGTTPDFLVARGYQIDKGRAFSEAESRGGRPLCVLGLTTVKELFGGGDPTGSSIRLGKVACEVIGVLASKGAGTMGGDADDLVLMPLRAFQQRIAGNRNISSIYLSVAQGRSTTAVKAQVEGLMRERRRIAAGAADDFNVRDVQEIIEAVSGTTKTLTALLGAIAAVSLLVGGIGIMNIMLVSVTERTREIGIRLAIGARGKDVLLQFLVEAVVLSTLGGALGVTFGLGGAYAATRALAVPFLVSPSIVVLAFVFSAAVGVVFGLLPARKAAQLNPIDALRHE